MRVLAYAFLALCLGAFALQPHFANAQTTRADQLFGQDDPNHAADIHRLAQRIEQGDALKPEDVAALGERVNLRHDQDITLLFHALASGNIPAVEALLAAGADPALPDRPGSERDFVYALTMPGGELLDRDGINAALQAYLSHGGNPNGSGRVDDMGVPLAGIRTVLPYGLALNGNYEGLRMVVDAGADPWLPEFRDGAPYAAAVDALAGDQAFAQLDALIDAGVFDHRQQPELERFLTALGNYAQRGDEPSREIKRIAMRVLKRNPHYVETVTHDARTRMIFKDHWEDPQPATIPWDDIRSDRVR